MGQNPHRFSSDRNETQVKLNEDEDESSLQSASRVISRERGNSKFKSFVRNLGFTVFFSDQGYSRVFSYHSTVLNQMRDWGFIH